MAQVLVIGDDHGAASSLALLLKCWGYEPAVAYDGPSALALASPAPPAALLDIGLPGVDGCEITRRLRGRALREVRRRHRGPGRRVPVRQLRGRRRETA